MLGVLRAEGAAGAGAEGASGGRRVAHGAFNESALGRWRPGRCGRHRRTHHKPTAPGRVRAPGCPDRHPNRTHHTNQQQGKGQTEGGCLIFRRSENRL
ncbi:hypothetical protein GCM10009665_42190 [Kitasatospora nipponensis]|uniref:Uncharacterized protein n=1 Tax=Kitasatospora nipponensis TaxID=258049 RepID=A0ABP4H123_9ACTN